MAPLVHHGGAREPRQPRPDEARRVKARQAANIIERGASGLVVRIKDLINEGRR
jgi:hypothetical protein